MKRVIKGRAYNTATSTVVASSTYDNTSKGGTRGFLALYQTRSGAFFLHENEVVAFRDRAGTLQQQVTDTFRPLTRDKACEWVTSGEVKLHSDLLRELPEAKEDAAPEATIYARVPSSLKAAVERQATAEGISVNAYVARCLEHCVRTRSVS